MIRELLTNKWIQDTCWWNKHGYEEMAIKDKARHDKVMQEVPLMEEAKLYEVWQLRAEKENTLIKLAQMDEEKKNKQNHGLNFFECKNNRSGTTSCDNRNKHLVNRRKQNPKT